jgi:predicted oxidoreductase (fatty acid repression mutant protein)
MGSSSLYSPKRKRNGEHLTEEFNKEEKIEPKITKMAKTDYPINEIISRRWSARAFSTRPVEKLKLLSILEAARWAPSSRNEQPWRYIVFTNDNPEKLKKAQSVLKEINDYAKKSSNSHLCDNKKNLY